MEMNLLLEKGGHNHVFFSIDLGLVVSNSDYSSFHLRVYNLKSRVLFQGRLGNT